MQADPAQTIRSRLLYLGFLTALITVYGFYLFPFTVFEGFTTLSSDAFGYVLLAKKWSPWFAASAAEVLTWPVHNYPPLFAWLLALSGASESTYYAHGLVSVMYLAAVFLAGWMASRLAGKLYGSLLTLLFCLLPGAVYSSMGILAENLFLVLSFSTLLLAGALLNRERTGVGSYVALTLLLLLALQTRTIGIALVGALAAVALFDRSLGRDKRIALLLVALGSIIAWQLWSQLLDPQSRDSAHLTFIRPIIDTGLIDKLMGYVKINLLALIDAWNRYLLPGQTHFYFFALSFTLLIVCLATTALRAVRLKLDALYVTFNLGILLLWPYPAEMLRFLHPVVMLLLMQPLFLFVSATGGGQRKPGKWIAVTLIVFLGANLAVMQAHMLDWRRQAQEEYPAAIHAREYYSQPNREDARRNALAFQAIMMIMKTSADVVPPGSRVVSDQHAAYTLLANRQAYNQSTIVPFDQQLCNFKVAEIDYLFISDLINSYNPFGILLYSQYANLAAEIWSFPANADPSAYLLMLDREKIRVMLEESGFECTAFRDRP